MFLFLVLLILSISIFVFSFIKGKKGIGVAIASAFGVFLFLLVACFWLLKIGLDNMDSPSISPSVENNVQLKPAVAPSQGGVSLYVKSLDQSTKNILSAGKEFNIFEYKQSELTEKNKIKTLFLTVPNDKVNQLKTILVKEANDKNVSGAKNLYGGFSDQPRPKDGTTNFEIKLIDVSIL